MTSKAAADTGRLSFTHMQVLSLVDSNDVVGLFDQLLQLPLVTLLIKP